MNCPAFGVRTRIAPKQSTQIQMRDASIYAKNHALNAIGRTLDFPLGTTIPLVSV
jgi:hypothetical protein